MQRTIGKEALRGAFNGLPLTERMTLASQKLRTECNPQFQQSFPSPIRPALALVDIPCVAFDVAIGGKPDMTFCTAYVCS